MPLMLVMMLMSRWMLLLLLGTGRSLMLCRQRLCLRCGQTGAVPAPHGWRSWQGA
jgi:hypothetical protein